MSLPRVLVVTGTDTDVGKTVATAALATTIAAAGRSVTVHKPTQTGVSVGEPGDVAEVARLSGVTGSEGVRLLAPMAPRPAAALEGATLPVLGQHVDTVLHHARAHDHVLVEGAGGLLVELTESGDTLADLATALTDAGAEVGVVLVARAALGTLNHTMLTREALSRRGIRCLGVVVGAWPDAPGPVETTNREVFEALPEGLLGVVPAGAPAWPVDAFRAAAPSWLPGLLDPRAEAPAPVRLDRPSALQRP